MLAQEHAHEHPCSVDEMEPSNPHSATHFGSYAFKPISVLVASIESMGLLEM